MYVTGIHIITTVMYTPGMSLLLLHKHQSMSIFIPVNVTTVDYYMLGHRMTIYGAAEQWLHQFPDTNCQCIGGCWVHENARKLCRCKSLMLKEKQDSDETITDHDAAPCTASCHAGVAYLVLLVMQALATFLSSAFLKWWRVICVLCKGATVHI